MLRWKAIINFMVGLLRKKCVSNRRPIRRSCGRASVVGARVTSGYWYSWTSSTTNANGYFSSGSTYTWGVDYHLHFDASDFVFQKNGMVEGPTGTKSAWNINLTGKWGTVAACFAGAWNYYYGNIDGLSRPHQNSWYNVKLDYEVKDEEFNNTGAAYHSVIPWLSQSITVFLKSSYTHTYIPSIEAFSNTTHETAHNAHYQHFQTRYWSVTRDFEWNDHVNNKVKESFAAGVEWWLMNKRYGSINGRTRDRFYGYFGDYTGVVEDMIDGFTSYAGRSFGGETVTDYSITTVGNAVERSFTFDELKNNIQQYLPKPQSPDDRYWNTASSFDDLFNYWSNI